MSQLATFSSDAGDASDATRMMTWGGGDASWPTIARRAAAVVASPNGTT